MWSSTCRGGAQRLVDKSVARDAAKDAANSRLKSKNCEIWIQEEFKRKIRIKIEAGLFAATNMTFTSITGIDLSEIINFAVTIEPLNET